MKINYLIIILSFFALTFSTSCKKEEEATISVIGKWVAISATLFPAYNGETDFFTDIEPCLKDNVFEFKNDGTYIVSEGETDCVIQEGLKVLSNLSTPHTGNYNVIKSNGFNMINLDGVQPSEYYAALWVYNSEGGGGTVPGPYTLKLEGNKMILSRTWLNKGEVRNDITFTITFEKQSN
jgi:hypothetical protein